MSPKQFVSTSPLRKPLRPEQAATRGGGLLGVDRFVTNTQIRKECIRKNIANAIPIRTDQIGTLTETLAAIEMAEAAS